MAIVVEEKFESPEGWSHSPGKAGGTMVFVVYNDQGIDVTRDEALAALADDTDESIEAGEYTVYRQSRTVEPVNLSTWIGRVVYAPDNVTQDNQYEFDTTGGTQHLTHDINTVGTYGSGAPNVQGAINTDASGINGVDITVPRFGFSEVHYKGNASVTATYKNKLMELTGTVNNATFKGHAAGEVLFLGAKGGRRSGEDWEIQFMFSASPNRTGLTIGGISGIAAKGWEYIDVLTEPDNETYPNVTLQKTVAVYVHQLYRYADFSDIGI